MYFQRFYGEFCCIIVLEFYNTAMNCISDLIKHVLTCSLFEKILFMFDIVINALFKCYASHNSLVYSIKLFIQIIIFRFLVNICHIIIFFQAWRNFSFSFSKKLFAVSCYDTVHRLEHKRGFTNHSHSECGGVNTY